MELDEKKIPTIFKAFCDENRVKILKLLLRERSVLVYY